MPAAPGVRVTSDTVQIRAVPRTSAGTAPFALRLNVTVELLVPLAKELAAPSTISMCALWVEADAAWSIDRPVGYLRVILSDAAFGTFPLDAILFFSLGFFSSQR